MDWNEFLKWLALMGFGLALGSVAFRLWPFGKDGLGPRLLDTLAARLPHVGGMSICAALANSAVISGEILSASVAALLTVIVVHWAVIGSRSLKSL